MATVVKTAAFGGLIRFIVMSGLVQTDNWQEIITVVAILTLIVGNVTALYQTNFKRLLAYSGIANAGYVLVAVATLQVNTYEYILYYLASYGVASILAFTIYSIIKDHTGINTIDGLKGLFVKNKMLAVTLAFAMLSLAGIPPLAGFFGKYAVFANAIQADQIWLVVVAVVTSLVGVFYYFRVMANAFNTNSEIPVVPIHFSYKLVLILGVIILLVLGLMPDLITDLIA